LKPHITDFEEVPLAFKRQESRFPTGSAIQRFTVDFRLPTVGQDWDLESADPNRVAEFLDFYDSQRLNDDEKFTLILASYDESLRKGNDETLQSRIVEHLLAEFDLLNYLVQYWSLPDEDEPDNIFHFTSIARQVMQTKYGDREKWPRTPFSIKHARTHYCHNKGVWIL
jgi:hypothetical protein